ncbi:dehydration-responsive element-binding protein 1A-like isoform X1 [Lotus japonicus]|uniref:dehydration-responsive element-binding protein 1A-like isoform X1 n=1 Tax=Lotus japonicus TaxID=34305 RepID=UPI00258F1A31|nr:dehydration-responsive element-binding protein 1A-like isoform X1 [Lotus japonicus]
MNSIDTEQYSAGSSSEACSDMMLASARPKKCAGCRVFKETRHPVYRGVRSRNNNKWVCEVRVPNDKTTRIWLGTHQTPEIAARAHDVAALALRGKSACLNFADSAWRVPPLLPASNSAKELRRVATEVAHAFAAEDRCHGQQQQQQQTYNGDQLCSTGDSVEVVENSNNSDKTLHDLERLCFEFDEVLLQGGIEEEQDLHGWIRNMEDEPLRSPQHPFEGSYEASCSRKLLS